MTDDCELLRLYVEDGSQEAFGELVRRRFAVVYGAALRQLGDAHKAQDVVQAVFTDLARKAATLRHRPILVSWLYTSTHFAATNLIRAEFRRRARDQQAQLMHDVNAAGAYDADWDQLRPVLDQEMHHLDDREREAILLRYFEELSFARIGEVLRLSEDAARKRVERALERLRGRLVKRGITSTTAALATMLAGHAGFAAPAALMESIAAAALVSAAGSGVSPAGILKIMSTKSTLGIAGVLGIAGIIGLVGIGTAIYEFRAARLERATLVAAQHSYEAKQAYLRELEQNAQAASARVADLQHSLDRMPAAGGVQRNTGAAPGIARSGRDPKADFKNFMATFPQVRGMMLDVAKYQVATEYAAFFRFAGLTVAQIAQFEDRTAAFWVDHEVVTPQGPQITSLLRLPDDQLDQILGDQGFAQFQEYIRVGRAYGFSGLIATQAGYTGEAVSPAQADQLAQIILNNSSSYQSGGDLDWNAIDWNTVAAQAKSLLSPAQWQAAQGAFSSQQLTQAVYQASNTK